MIGIVLALAMFNFHAIIAKLVSFKTSLSKSIENSRMSDRPASDSACPTATRLKIIYKGNVSYIDTNCDQDVARIITEALTFFNVPSADAITDNFKLILVSTCKALNNATKLVNIADLKTNDELLLVPRVVHYKVEDERLRTEALDKMESPTAQEILAMTADVEPKNTTRNLPLGCSSNFMAEIRKIFITLTQTSALLLSVTAEADAIAADLKQRLQMPGNPPALANLMALGYDPANAGAALRLHHMDGAAALEWLLAEYPVNPTDASTSEGSSPAFQPTPSPPPEEPDCLVSLVARLVDEFRKAKRLAAVPNQRAVQHLTEMGFVNVPAVQNALLVTGNNQTYACEWLLGERRLSMVDLDSGLDETSRIYSSVMANPAILMGLRSPRVLLALLSMIENPDCINKWLRDPEASPVIQQVFKTYHAEKHSA